MMRLGTMFAGFSAAMLLAGSSVAGPPLDGVYDSTDLGGPVFLGRYTEAWTPSGGALLPGTTLNAESWDGMVLGSQWRYYCGTEPTPAILLLDNVDGSGNGNRTYMKTFAGGYIWLSGTGPWANGDPDYPGLIDSYVEFETIQYVNWVRVAAVTNVQASAHFDSYPSSCMTFSVGNGVEIGSTDFGETKPATYPDLLEENTCAPVMDLGAWWDLTNLTLSITGCTVSTEEMTWGAIKAQYRD